jgi:hypothetical protein
MVEFQSTGKRCGLCRVAQLALVDKAFQDVLLDAMGLAYV